MPRRGEQVSIDLEHVTAVMDQGLAELSNDASAPYLMNVSMWVRNSILVGQRWSPLILQSGLATRATFLAQLEYFGDHNFYEGTDVFWKVTPADESEQLQFDFDLWRAHWTTDKRPRWQRVQWAGVLDTRRPVHQHRVADYLLSRQNNPAVESTEGRLDAGFIQGELPRLPDFLTAISASHFSRKRSE